MSRSGCRFSVVVADCQVSADNRQPITDNTELPDTLFRGAVLSEAADRIGRELCRWWRRAEHAPRRTVLQEAGRSARYSAVEIAAPAFDGLAPDASDLSRRWHAALENATQIVATLPYGNVGKCVLRGGELFRGDAAALREVLADREIHFHPGSIRGAFPQIT